jgi:hypothetical protein
MTGILRLDVRPDTSLFGEIRAIGLSAGADRVALRARLARAVAVSGILDTDPAFLGESIDEWFDVEAMATAGFWAGQDAIRSHIEANLAASVSWVEPAFPALPQDGVLRLRAVLLPGFRYCFGPAAEVQLFGLYPGAMPAEAVLFLAHTYYHEASSIFATQDTRAAERDPTTASRFLHWLLSLIRNEGLANFAVLDRILLLRDQGCDFRYFTYADMIGRPEPAAAAMRACRELAAKLDQRTVHAIHGRMNEILKNPRLPIINLVGIRMAEAISRELGRQELLDCATAEPQRFFALYEQTGDALREQLFGPDCAFAGQLTGSLPTRTYRRW